MATKATANAATRILATGGRSRPARVACGAPTATTRPAARRRGSTSKVRLTALERDVLDECCQTRVTRSAVALTIDLVDRKRLNQFGDPVGLVCATLADLNERGFLRYGLSGDAKTLAHTSEVGVQYGGVPIYIRVTTEGYHAVGYDTVTHEVGRHHNLRAATDDGAVKHPGDRTDFRTLSGMTTGGEIERCTLEEHLLRYPDHMSIHPDPVELRREIAMTRAAAQYDPTVVGEIIAMRTAGKSWQEISDKVKIPKGTLSSPASTIYQLVQEVRAERDVERVADSIVTDAATTSLRSTLLSLIEARGPISDSRDIPGMLQRGGGRFEPLHGVQHMLGTLHKQGLVTYIERQGGNQKWYARIELARPKGNGRQLEHQDGTPVFTGRADQVAEREAAPPGMQAIIDATTVTETPSETPAPALPSEVHADGLHWPILDQLRKQQEGRAKAQEKAERYFQAAALLEGDDADKLMVDSLVEAANNLMTDHNLTPAEAEYLAYAAAAEGGRYARHRQVRHGT